MSPGGRLAAAIDVLMLLRGHARPADAELDGYFRARRYIGAGDRRAIAGMVYGVLRHQARLDWLLARIRVEVTDDTRERLRLLAWLVCGDGWSPHRVFDAFGGSRHAPPPLARREQELVRRLTSLRLDDPTMPVAVRGECPDWLHGRLAARFGDALPGELAALAGQAPFDLRVNTLKGDRARASGKLREEGITRFQPCALSPIGLRFPERQPIGQWAAFKEGFVEIQDEGSQLASLLVEAAPGHRVLDLCAGAGGKTLAVAAQMHNTGRITACDVSEGRLRRARERLARAGVSSAEARPIAGLADRWLKRQRPPGAKGFDRVIVDAPCTGTGTWRRNPDLRWRMTERDLEELTARQAALIDAGAALVAPGGRLAYITCSLLPAENEDQVTALLARRPELRVVPVPEIWARVIPAPCPADGPFLQLTPRRDGTDGFFVAVLERAGDVSPGTPRRSGG